MIRVLRILALFIPVILGGFIYLIFRTEKLIMFSWFEYLNLSGKVNVIQNFRNIFSFPDWFIYSFPDGLWVFSYTAISLEIWKNSINSQNICWILSIPIVAVFSEFLQLFKIIPGTFDLLDVIFYFLGIIIPYYISTIIIFKSKKHEKT
ncbi:hypothetical protein D3C71_08140 [compost metagenome]